MYKRFKERTRYAGMAELADALDSGSSRSNSVEVQVLLPAPNKDYRRVVLVFSFIEKVGGLEGPMVNDCRWQSEPATQPGKSSCPHHASWWEPPTRKSTIQWDGAFCLLYGYEDLKSRWGIRSPNSQFGNKMVGLRVSSPEFVTHL